jgi:RimJ/RimL family protein N-acetyltransferase
MPQRFWLRTHSLNTKAQRFYAREGMRHLRNEPHPRHPEELFSVFERRSRPHVHHGPA